MGNKEKIFILDDNKFFCEMKKEVLEQHGYLSDYALDADTGLEKIKSRLVGVVLLDLQLKETSGIDIIPKIKEIDSSIMIIMLTGHGTIHSAVSAIKQGAYDYLTKEVEDEELLLRIEKAIEKRKDILHLEQLKESLWDKYSFQNIIGTDKKMQEIYKLIESVCNTDATVLIYGETGTGKELIARAIHFNSLRKGNPFIAVNCAAISETLMESEVFGHEKGAFTGAYKQKPGKIELADKGTLFLDEIGDMSIQLQAKLLRFLQYKTFERVGGTQELIADVRVVSATHQNLEKMIEQGKFRQDLFYRLNVVHIEIPPLRERIGDLPLLLDYLIKQINAKLNKNIEKFSQEAIEELAAYNWPGNIRELENLIERIALTCNEKAISKDSVSRYLRPAEVQGEKTGVFINPDLTLDEIKGNVEKKYIEMLLSKYHGNINLVAKITKMTTRTIYNKIKTCGINIKDYK